MARVIRYLVLLIVVAAAAAWFADTPGNVTLEWGGWRVDTSAGILALAVIAVAAATALFYRVWLFVRRAPASVRGAWRTRRRTRGYQALTKGMVAVAAGDADEARRQTKRAEGLLNEPPLTMLLSAQAAQLSGDERAAERFFRAMTENRETEFLGLRGLLTQAMKRGGVDEAVQLARRAHRLKPDSEWVSESLFELETRTGQWSDAGATVKEALRHRHLTPTEGSRRQAALACQIALEKDADGDRTEAIRQARSALDFDPRFLPAAILLARLWLDEGKARKAAGVIERMWGHDPHPDLVPLYWKARGAEAALDRVKASQRLAGNNPDHAESHLAVARAALDAELWGEARDHLNKAGGDEPPARVCRMMAALEEAEHHDHAKAREWLMKASLADPDPAWVCGTCGNTVGAWSATCGNCHAFDSYMWRTPPHVMHLADDTADWTGALPAPDRPGDAGDDVGEGEGYRGAGDGGTALAAETGERPVAPRVD